MKPNVIIEPGRHDQAGLPHRLPDHCPLDLVPTQASCLGAICRTTGDKVGGPANLAASAEMTCQQILPDMTKSSASHHWRVLRECGLVAQRREGRFLYQQLRRADLDDRFPGVIAAVLGH